MPYYYAVCTYEDIEITERVISEFFHTPKDTLCRGPHSGHRPFDCFAVCFYVNKKTFKDIAKRLLPEAIYFLDSKGELIEFEDE